MRFVVEPLHQDSEDMTYRMNCGTGMCAAIREQRPFGLSLILVLILLITGSVSAQVDYRFPREQGTTEDGYPLPLTGKPITKTPIVSEEGVSVKEYPEHYIPGQESLAENEMRITACGSGTPAPLRIGQGASCLLVELGNGDVFIFDIGGGTVGNLFALGVHPARLDKVFITHFHLDHVGGIFPLFDAMGWARNTPLHVWGSSGYTPELGITAFTQHVRAAAEWHIQNKQSILPMGGMTIVPHEVDITKFSPENPRQLAYNENGVRIYAFPVVHALAGSMGYRLEWNGLTFVYTADSQASTFEAEQGKGADVFIHEIMPSAAEFAYYNHMPLAAGEGVMEEHTTPAELGRVYSIAKPRLGVGSHNTLDDALIDPLFQRWGTTYSDPVLLMQDLTTINVTSDYIVVRQTLADQLAWPAPPPEIPEGTDLSTGEVSKAQRPDWLTATRLSQEP
jgi:ribonuclease Z